MPEPQNLHVDAILTNLSIQYRNEKSIWRNVLPIIKVGKRSDLFWVYNKEDSYRPVDDTIKPKAMPNEADWGVSQDNYSVKDHGLGDWLDQESIDNADTPLRPEATTNDFLNNNLDLQQELRVAALVFNANSYPAGNKAQLSGTGQWGGAADDPITNIETAIEGCFIRANTLVFGVDAWIKFRKLPEILDAVKSSTRYQGSPGGLATPAEVSGLFEVPNICIGRMRYISSKRGQTNTFVRVWGKHCSALYIDPSPSIETITFGATFSESNRTTMRDFDPKRGVKGAHYFKVAWNSDEHLIASDVGYFIQDAVA